jgi:hypothetical protein
VGTTVIRSTTEDRNPALLGPPDMLDAGHAGSIDGVCPAINDDRLACLLDAWDRTAKTGTP